MSKRGRVDGQLSKEDYHSIENKDNSIQYGQFTKATPNTLSTRRMVVAKRPAKREQFANHIHALNKAFHNWVKEQLTADVYNDLTDGFQDYIDHVTSLEDRYLRSYGEVLTFGSGDCGQLAHGIENDEDLMVRFPRVVYSLRDKKVCGIACGGIHNAAYTESGQVYTWGCADDGSLGRIGEESTPLLVEGDISNETVIGVACGDGQTIAVTTTGDVWGWGCYKDKEGKKWFNPSPDASNPAKDIKKQQNTAIKISGLKNVVEVACGSSFNLAKCADGSLYSWGLGEAGELGRYTPPLRVKNTITGEMEYDTLMILQRHITPGKMYIASSSNNISNNKGDTGLVAISNVKGFGCGAYHSLVVVVGDIVYACGLNNYGQLGLGDEDTTSRDYLTKVPALCHRGIISLKGGMHHSFALSSSTGKILAFGRGDSGQLGSQQATGKTAGYFSAIPLEPDLPPGTRVSAISCGGNHNLALTVSTSDSNNNSNSSEVYSWGYGDMLALGHGEEKDELLPKKLNFAKAKIRNITIKQVAGGGQHSAIIGQVVST